MFYVIEYSFVDGSGLGVDAKDNRNMGAGLGMKVEFAMSGSLALVASFYVGTSLADW